MSLDKFRGNENIADVVSIDPDADIDKIRDAFINLIRWLGDREPVSPGDPFLKFSTFGSLVALNVITEKDVLEAVDPGSTTPETDPASLDEQYVEFVARDLTPSVTAGCSVLQVQETSAANPNLHYLAFDPATDESCDWTTIMPQGWVGGTFQFRLYWSHPFGSVAWDVVWELQANAYGSGEALARVLVSGSRIVSTGGDPDTLYITSESDPVPISATLDQPGDMVILRLTRKATNAADTLTVDAHLHAIRFNIGNAPVDYPPPLPFKWNASDKSGGVTLTALDLTASASTHSKLVRGTVSKNSGKWYFEVTVDTAVVFGTLGLALATESLATWVGGGNDSWGVGPDHTYHSGASTSNPVFSIASGQVVGVAWDADNGHIWFSKANVYVGNSGVSGGAADPATGFNPRYTGVVGALFPACAPGAGGQMTINATLVYAPPTGFLPWE